MAIKTAEADHLLGLEVPNTLVELWVTEHRINIQENLRNVGHSNHLHKHPLPTPLLESLQYSVTNKCIVAIHNSIKL